MNKVYITSAGVFLPNKAISNEEIEAYLGKINGKPSSLKEKILKQNGIKNRYLALDKNQESTHSNAEMAGLAIQNALEKNSLQGKNIQLLVTGTTQGDLPIPGFASMVHAEVDFGNCELASFQSVCTSGMMAVKNAFHQIQVGEKDNAVCVGSEFASRLFKASRFEAQEMKRVPFDTEFLRWMLSDGAGALVLENKIPESGICLSVDWMELKSHANEYPLCMFTGKNDNKNADEKTWLDYPDYESASKVGVINLKQDVRLLDQVVKVGVAHYFDLIDQKKINPEEITYLCCHYSSEIPVEKWFSNLSTKGNTGSASIFIMLEELMYSGKLKAGDKILCMVPESGRFITSFMQLTVVQDGKGNKFGKKLPIIESPELNLSKSETSEWLVRNLSKVWIDFETQLYKVPIIQKIQSGKLKLEDYKLLLMDLRQQVIDGSQWISRAASNIDIELFDLRSAFIKHTAAEHKDYQILEKNWVNLGGDLNAITSGEKNIGSLALTSFIFQQASKNNPIDLLGAMFIIEGIGKRLATDWGNLIKVQLKLNADQVSFFTYHGVADEKHFENLEKALDHPLMNMELAKHIVKTAKTTAKLYKLQFEELGNY
jgi:3-oxoacyl-[acyl-carrier-protein] synthase-3